MTHWGQTFLWSLEFMIHQNLEHDIIVDNKSVFPLFTSGKYISGGDDSDDVDDELFLRNG